MFSGIDEVDWASMEHAYGPADDVPELLRGLASDDPAERETALDGMYGAVHHQGDVYACTLACIPFLFELVVDPGVQDRGCVVELLTSIGGFDLDEDDEDEIDEDEIEGAANYAMAAAAVTAGAGVFFELIADEDPGVRLAAPLALATLHRHPVRVLALLRERLPVEPDEEVRLALVEAAGRVALRHRPLAGRVAEWLNGLASRAHTPGLRLAALAQLARCSPDVLPGDVVPVVSGLLREMRAAPEAPPAPTECAATGTNGAREPGGARDLDGTGGLGGARAPDSAPEPGRETAAEAGSGAGSGAGAAAGAGAGAADGTESKPRSVAGAGAESVAGAGSKPESKPGSKPGSGAAATAGPGPADGSGAMDQDPDSEPVAAPEGCRSEQVAAPTLVGQLRALSAQDSPGHGTPWAADLLRTLHVGLDDRVGDRTALLADQLRSPDRWQRIDAVRMSGGLIRAWRGPYEELVALVGDQLGDPEPRLAEAACHVLEELFRLAAPAADALAARLAADPGGWVKAWAGGPPGLGSTVKALARLGDPRAVPALAAALELPQVAHDVGFAVGHLGAAARPLAGALRRRLAEVELDEGAYDRASPLLAGLTGLRAGEAAPEVLRVLRGAPAYRGDWLRTAALRALASFGPAAREAVPELRALIRHPGTAAATEAAEALWAISGDTGAVLPVLIEGLQSDQVHDRRAAAVALGALGPRAEVVAPRLRGLLAHDELWLRVDAAIALWEVSGRPRETTEVLLAAWERSRHVRVRVAECLARMGPVPEGSAAAHVLHTELASVRRHNAMDGGYGSHDIHEDEKLLTLCRRALRRTGHGTGRETGKGTTA
ncbi:HEAT repeat domain-containing protein [Streptomyces sp. C11-1]|uniref:HEAT repeat domain-containing protein n=1 Tax=Streptomyces durocortorensis TaxID=2811104 RepID=A0ABY9W0L5_9ACTN|nr:HEAT repeat domain-containing protein [Streptomyces durocortorensis]WNF29568.1 HEAT repeat domain-containing protein [Streptomyces durocortorensis]